MNCVTDKKRILLHSCCGPCSTAVIRRLIEDYEVSVFYFNPNITDSKEYELRKSEQIRFLNEFCSATGVSIHFVEGCYDPEAYYSAVNGLEQEPEGGLRCAVCFNLRLEETAKQAIKGNFDLFDTTLTVSPHKDYQTILGIGKALSKAYGIEYAGGNYKKQDGYKLSIEMSKAHGLYRQHYCGCEFSEAAL
ncbi:MAG: epoxyqueuosine reductase QueH [Clostridia bacterium]|nr:epoxyqueuosine reductase QueH [Clostridia bacterium]